MNAVALPKQYLEITLEDNAVFADIKRAMKMIRGVVSVRIASPAKVDNLNSTTIKAIKEVRAGKTHKASSVDDLISRIIRYNLPRRAKNNPKTCVYKKK